LSDKAFVPVISVLEPKTIVQGVVCYTMSVYQQLLFCLFESGILKVYSTRLADAPQLAEFSIQEPVPLSQGTCMELIDTMPLEAQKPSGNEHADYFYDLRGDSVPWYINEIIVLGTKSGSLLFIDTLNNCEVTLVTQALQASVDQVVYRHVRKELFAVSGGKTSTMGFTVIRMWKLPSMTCVLELNDLAHVTSFAISPTMPHFGVGRRDGQ
jgi:hypothetical protein